MNVTGTKIDMKLLLHISFYTNELDRSPSLRKKLSEIREQNRLHKNIFSN